MQPPSAATPNKTLVAATEKDKKKKEQKGLTTGEEDEPEEEEQKEQGPPTKKRKGVPKVLGGNNNTNNNNSGGGRAPRGSAVKLKLETDIALLKKDLDHLKVQLEARDKLVAKLEDEVKKLEKQLIDERSESKRFYHQVDGHKTNLMADLTYHMAKSHHSAMQTIQTSQQTNAQVLASALGQTILRIKDKGNKLKALMPPLPDLTQPNAKQIFHDQVASFLNQKVTKLEEGQALLAQIDAAIADSQLTIDDERKRISPTLSKQELADLQKTLGEEEIRISALKYQRGMLFEGLNRNAAKNLNTEPPKS